MRRHPRAIRNATALATTRGCSVSDFEFRALTAVQRSGIGALDWLVNKEHARKRLISQWQVKGWIDDDGFTPAGRRALQIELAIRAGLYRPDAPSNY